MDFKQAVMSGFQNYATFSGRAARSEYWYWFLFCVLASAILSVVDAAVLGQPGTSGSPGFLSTIFSLATLIPGIAVGVRRLHDIDRSGWWLLIGFVPLIGVIVLLIWFCKKGTAGSNRFGEDLLAGGVVAVSNPGV